MKPLFVDNRNGNTLARAVAEWFDELGGSRALPQELRVASAYVNLGGLRVLHAAAERVPKIRLLLGAEPTPEGAVPRRKPGDPPEPEFTQRRVRVGLDRLERTLRDDRNLLPFELEEDTALRILVSFLRSAKIETRLYGKHFLHAKAFILDGPDPGVVSGSSNLTYAGLHSNLELNLGNYQPALVGRVRLWFDELWDEAVPFDLAAIYEEALASWPPYLVYLLVLWQLYHDELAEEQFEMGSIPVTTFQLHGVWRAKRILRELGGVLIADGVGLGKTFTAGEIIREYRERRQRVLLVCPAALRDTTWKRFLNDYQLLVECLSYEELANEKQLGGITRHLQNPLEDYALLVVDEAHNYRNPDTPMRAEILRKLLRGKRRDLVLLTATPVNNSLWDLYHVLRYFLRQDAALAAHKIRSIRQKFEEAMEVDPFDLNPDLLYPVIDATTVKRTRRFVKKYYANDLIRAPDGKKVPIRFPRPTALSVRYDLEPALPGFFFRLEGILMPPNGKPLLTMARYQAEGYRLGTKDELQDTVIVGLLRSALLKRFESSVESFRRTLRKMEQEHIAFLAALAKGRVIHKEVFKELSASDAEMDIDEILQSADNVEDASDYDIKRLRVAVEADLKLLQEMIMAVADIDARHDPKLAVLTRELSLITQQASREGGGEEDQRQKEKVLVFSHYEDTIDWIEQYLISALEVDKRIVCYRGRIASVSGADSRRGISRQKALNGFAPVSTGALPPDDADIYDLLLCTDVLAEGMNLQQCRHVINYDLPWNPMRLVQRHGRIDRINSPHEIVYLRTFFPDIHLEDMLDLEARVRRKLAQAAASVGVETPPIEGARAGEQTFAETREEIEKLRREDATIYDQGGSEGAAQTGELYRQELRAAVDKIGEKIKRLPWRIGSGMPGKRTGWLFCAVVGDRVYLRFVPADATQTVIAELGTCLRFIECEEGTPRIWEPWMQEGVYNAWTQALASIHEAWTAETDPANLHPRVPRLNREIADFLRNHPPHDFDQGRLDRCIDSVESPWSRREENLLREEWSRDPSDDDARARAIVQKIEEIGVEPFRAPEPLPPISREDIHLVCWMGLKGTG